MHSYEEHAKFSLHVFASQLLTGEKQENYECQVFATTWLAKPIESCSKHSIDIVFMFFAGQLLTDEKHASLDGQVFAASACMFFASQTLTGEKHENYERQVLAKAWPAKPSDSFGEHFDKHSFHGFRQSNFDWRKT